MSENGRITLREVTVELLHEYYKNFVRDPDIFMDMSTFTEYKYSYDQIMQRYAMLKSQKGRVDFMIMLEDLPIGEVALKHIDKEKSECELSIHLQNDSVKNKGYGTQAEKLAIDYAKNKLKLKTVKAKAILKNTRSQRVLEKVGFIEIDRDDMFIYYKLDC